MHFWIGYVVCRPFDLDCSTRSSDYIKLYQGDTAVISKSLALIQATAAKIIEAFENASVKDEVAA